MERKNMVGLIIENSNLKTRITKLEEKIKSLEDLSSGYFASHKNNVERYFNHFPNKNIDRSKMKPFRDPNKYTTPPIKIPPSPPPPPPSIEPSPNNSPVKDGCLHYEYLKCKSDSDIIIPVKVNRFKSDYVDSSIAM